MIFMSTLMSTLDKFSSNISVKFVSFYGQEIVSTTTSLVFCNNNSKNVFCLLRNMI